MQINKGIRDVFAAGLGNCEYFINLKTNHFHLFWQQLSQFRNYLTLYGDGAQLMVHFIQGLRRCHSSGLFCQRTLRQLRVQAIVSLP